MYKNSTKDPLVAVVTAGLGAGAVACISVSQGQNVFVAVGVTIFATTVALIVDHLFFN
jgi:ABC-type Fe3+-siderophore transport system permease subunit